jgi:glutamine synthetase
MTPIDEPVSGEVTADPVPGGRPGEVEHAERLVEELTGRGVQGVVLSWVDTCGVNRIKTVPLRRLPSAVAWGTGMSPVFDTFLTDDSIATSENLGSPDGDLRLYPDLGALVPLAAQPGWAWAPVDRISQDGEPWPVDQRTFARRMTARAAQAGLTVRAAVEVEWAVGLGDAPDGGFVPACAGPGYSMVRLVELSDYARDVMAALEEQGVPVDQLHPEYAAGQYEVSVGVADPVTAADRSVLVKQTIRAVSQRHGLRASFAPSVVAGTVGNGGHLHLSIWRDGRNLFAGGDLRYGMTAEAEAFTAGVLDALPALCAISVPHPSGYLRLVPSHWSGAYQCWGRETRESALRLVTGMVGARDRSANLELKAVDLSANPYLLVGCVLAAGLDGLDRGLDLPAEITGDPARFGPDELAARGLNRLPGALPEAVAAFEKSAVLTGALGPLGTEAVVTVRNAEAARFVGTAPMDIAAAVRWVF